MLGFGISDVIYNTTSKVAHQQWNTGEEDKAHSGSRLTFRLKANAVNVVVAVDEVAILRSS